MCKICTRCGTGVLPEVDKGLKEEYPFYCPNCDENMYSFECEDIMENIEERKNKIIRYLVIEDYIPLNSDWIRNKEGMIEAVKSLLQSETIRMRNCDGAAVELNTI